MENTSARLDERQIGENPGLHDTDSFFWVRNRRKSAVDGRPYLSLLRRRKGNSCVALLQAHLTNGWEQRPFSRRVQIAARPRLYARPLRRARPSKESEKEPYVQNRQWSWHRIRA